MQPSSQQFKRLNISTENIQKFRNLLILIMADQRTKGAPETLESFETLVVNSMEYMLNKIHRPYTDDDITGAFLISLKNVMEGEFFTFNADYIPVLADSVEKLNKIEREFLVKINFDIPPSNIVQQQPSATVTQPGSSKVLIDDTTDTVQQQPSATVIQPGSSKVLIDNTTENAQISTTTHKFFSQPGAHPSTLEYNGETYYHGTWLLNFLRKLLPESMMKKIERFLGVQDQNSSNRPSIT